MKLWYLCGVSCFFSTIVYVAHEISANWEWGQNIPGGNVCIFKREMDCNEEVRFRSFDAVLSTWVSNLAKQRLFPGEPQPRRPALMKLEMISTMSGTARWKPNILNRVAFSCNFLRTRQDDSYEICKHSEQMIQVEPWVGNREGYEPTNRTIGTSGPLLEHSPRDKTSFNTAFNFVTNSRDASTSFEDKNPCASLRMSAQLLRRVALLPLTCTNNKYFFLSFNRLWKAMFKISPFTGVGIPPWNRPHHNIVQ